MHIRTAWGDYFTGDSTLQQQKLYETRQTLSGTGVYVLSCLFRSIKGTSDGGALYCNSVTYLLVESSSFFSCTTSNQYGGGAIYFSNGQCVLHEVCGYDCYITYTSSSFYQFACIYVNNAVSSKNYVNYSSIVRCVNVNSDSYYTLRLTYGKICCPSVNISMNKCQCCSGVLCQPYTDSSSFTGSFLYSSFADNIANGHTCLYLWMGSSKTEIKNCNILRNTQGTLGSGGTIYTLDNVLIEGSCILENKATYTFRIHSSSYTITLSNCTVDSTSCNLQLTIQKTVTKSFIHALSHMSTHNCHSEYDSVGTLTPIIQTPSSSKKQIQCFTFGKCSCRPQSFHIIFIFNFIHPYASIDLWY
jgi:hypothetical protein